MSVPSFLFRTLSSFLSSADLCLPVLLYSTLQIPMDVIWLDIEYSKDHMYGVWDEVAFPQPEKMLQSLDSKGRKVGFSFLELSTSSLTILAHNFASLFTTSLPCTTSFPARHHYRSSSKENFRLLPLRRSSEETTLGQESRWEIRLRRLVLEWKR